MREATPRPRHHTYIMRAAAGLAAVAALAFVVLPNLPQEQGELYTTPIGGRATIALSDGSQVFLNTDTALRIGTKKRTATLERGEAYFDIRHNADHPFVVTVANHKVVDLGTKFSVRAEGETIEVALVEGLARIDSTSQSRSVTITPGQIARATAQKIAIAEKPIAQMQNALSWQRGVLLFDNVTLAEAVKELSRYSTRKFTIADPKLAGRTLYGAVPTNDIDAFIRVARTVMGLKVETRGEDIVISH